ncbi:hypothetical protein PC116_g1257 [Phytophthora cactorum]|nr:hypothetical protein PC116_g1257 [Phytophthora cactorum]
MTYSLRLPARCTEHAGSLLGKNAESRTTGNTPSVGRAVATSSTTITSVTGPSVGAEGKDGDAGAEGAPFGWPSDGDGPALDRPRTTDMRSFLSMDQWTKATCQSDATAR